MLKITVDTEKMLNITSKMMRIKPGEHPTIVKRGKHPIALKIEEPPT
jgi:hypothetical protein